jgi:ubiquinone/menaquinone biosynthesis C-methylase UbiE
MESGTNRQTRFWDSFADKYDSFINRNAKEVYQQILSRIKSMLSKEMDILEIGSGTGLITFAVAPAVNKIIAIDSSERMIQLAKEKQEEKHVGDIEFKKGDAVQTGFSAGTFDMVIAVNLLHLIPSPEKALVEMMNVLKEDGKIVLPTYCHGAGFRSRATSWFMSLFGFRVRSRWSPGSFRRFVESAGLIVGEELQFKGKIPLSYIMATKSTTNE